MQRQGIIPELHDLVASRTWLLSALKKLLRIDSLSYLASGFSSTTASFSAVSSAVRQHRSLQRGIYHEAMMYGIQTNERADGVARTGHLCWLLLLFISSQSTIHPAGGRRNFSDCSKLPKGELANLKTPCGQVLCILHSDSSLQLLLVQQISLSVSWQDRQSLFYSSINRFNG